MKHRLRNATHGASVDEAMRYFVTLDSSEVAVDVVSRPDGTCDVTFDGEHVDADVVPLRDGISVRVGHKVFDLTLDGKGPELGVVAPGVRGRVKVENDRMRAASHARRKQQNDSEGAVTAPMPGRIVKVLVEAGALVERDAPLVVVEAMKMENELRAPRDGTISKVSVRAGDRVEAGTMLIELE